MWTGRYLTLVASLGSCFACTNQPVGLLEVEAYDHQLQRYELPQGARLQGELTAGLPDRITVVGCTSDGSATAATACTRLFDGDRESNDANHIRSPSFVGVWFLVKEIAVGACIEHLNSGRFRCVREYASSPAPPAGHSG